ncbi:hypothetical protein TKK_0004770 [Trichogramma kaykai]
MEFTMCFGFRLRCHCAFSNNAKNRECVHSPTPTHRQTHESEEKSIERSGGRGACELLEDESAAVRQAKNTPACIHSRQQATRKIKAWREVEARLRLSRALLHRQQREQRREKTGRRDRGCARCRRSESRDARSWRLDPSGTGGVAPGFGAGQVAFGTRRESRQKLSFGVDDYTPAELRNYPIVLHVVEVIGLLVSKGLMMNFYTRFRILKFWMKVRRYDIECSNENEDIYEKCYNKYLWDLFSEHLHMQEKFGFFMKQKTVEYLRRRREELKEFVTNPSYECPKTLDKWSMEEGIMKSIMLNKDVSMYQLCRMSYARGYSVLEKMKDWRLPALLDLQLSGHFVKRHVAKILMRPQFELFAADLFMTDHCRLGLPYTACRIVAEHTSDEDLYRLCEKTSEEDLEPALTVQGANVRTPEDYFHS